ncbi:MAG TPA: helix-turn-helix domain-containing protein [Blastocatellia bacterium]|nr:helix-turn-helix domain-containing protein [Blastocatellia bacterium]
MWRQREDNLRESSVYDDGVLRVEHDNYYVTCGGQRILLSRKEFLILSRLARTAGGFVRSEELWRYAWGQDAPFNSASLRVHIHRLRHAFARHGFRVENMAGVGYRLSTDIEATGNAR